MTPGPDVQTQKTAPIQSQPQVTQEAGKLRVTVETAVLFDLDRSDLKPQAEAVLAGIKSSERYLKLARQRIQHWAANVKPMCEAISRPMCTYCTRPEKFYTFLAVGELLKKMVARDGFEPPTPAFSGPRSTN